MSQIPPIYNEHRSLPKPEIINGLEYSPGSVYQPPQAGRSPGVVIAIALGGLAVVTLLLVGFVALGYQVIANATRANTQQQQAAQERAIIQQKIVQQAIEQELAREQQQQAKQKRQQELAERNRQRDAAVSEVKRRIEQAQAEFNKAAERAKAEQQRKSGSLADSMMEQAIRRSDPNNIEVDVGQARIRAEAQRIQEENRKRYSTRATTDVDKIIEESRARGEALRAESNARMKKSREDSTRRMDEILKQQREENDRFRQSIGLPPVPGR
ncbi:MAG TPA: hypothetical protein VL096_19775 [Pirellulaceae bacterium]|nr:hypothetical protein [Pirellulaceae bacterium]